MLRRPPRSTLFPSRRSSDLRRRPLVARDVGRELLGVGPRRVEPAREGPRGLDRKSTRLNSSHRCISYAVFCLKKKKYSTNRLRIRKNSYILTTMHLPTI